MLSSTDVLANVHETSSGKHGSLAAMLSIMVPATSANLGAGFDCLGVAINLYLKVQAQFSDHHSFVYQGQGFVANDADNLVHQGFFAVYRELDEAIPAIRFDVNNPIPLARGLGSSSAALVAGAAIADHMLGSPLGREGIFQVVAGIEGHPDNVAPAIFGGYTVSAQRGAHFITTSLAVPSSWMWLFGVPAFELLTSEARAVLPSQYSRAEVIFNASRTALFTLAVSQNKPELLATATEDVIHQPYRYPLIPGIDEASLRLKQAGADGVYLSGAGPTLGAIVSQQESLLACQNVLQDFVGPGCVLTATTSGGYFFDVEA